MVKTLTATASMRAVTGRRKPRRATRLLSFLAVAVVAAGAGVGVTLAVDQPAASTTSTSLPGSGAVPSPATSPSSGGTTGTVGAQEVVNKVEPGLVVVNTTLKYSSEAAAGTGMVINSDGLVLTNNHVIENSTKITATVITTGKTYPATVIGYDKTADVALIRLQGATGLHTVPIGNSAAVKTGEAVLALGNAEGTGAIVPAGGQVTGLDKTITASDEGVADNTETLHGIIQINAGIVPGDSGGPLSTSTGQVIGIDTAGDSTSTGQQPPEGFAIPSTPPCRWPADRRWPGQLHGQHRLPAVRRDLHRLGTSSNPRTQAQQQEQQNGFGDGTGGLGGFNGFGGSGSSPVCYTSNTNLAVPTAIAPVGSGHPDRRDHLRQPGRYRRDDRRIGDHRDQRAGGRLPGQPGQHPGPVQARRHHLGHLGQPGGQQTTSTVHLTAGPPH